MAMTDDQLKAVAREFAQRVFVTDKATAHSNVDDLKSAIQEIDQAMNATTTQVEAAAPGVVLKVAMKNQAQTGAPSLTATQAGVCLALWALEEVGLL